MSIDSNNRAFSVKLLGQTVAVWAGSGLFSALAVSPDGCGVPVLLGVGTSALGLLFVSGLAAAGPDDCWYLLRWVNTFLNEAFVATPFITWIAVQLVMAMFGGPKVGAPLTPQQSLVLQYAVMMGMIVGAVVRLAMMWEKVRHADLPTGTEE